MKRYARLITFVGIMMIGLYLWIGLAIPGSAQAEPTVTPGFWEFLPLIFGPPVEPPTATPTETPTPTETMVVVPATSTFTSTPTLTPVISDTPTATSTPSATPTPTFTATPTATSSPTPTNTPAPGQLDGVIAISSDTGGLIGGVAYSDEDILWYHTPSGRWALSFDGSDMGLGGVDLDAFDYLPDGSLLLSPNATVKIPGLGDVMGEDIIRFVPLSLGTVTDGDLEWYFDGSDVGLSGSYENIDAFDVTVDGRLLISTSGDVNASGVLAADEDLLIFTPSALGSTTAGSWSLYLDGSRNGLGADSEDIDAVWRDPTSNDVFFSTVGNFSVTGATGVGADILRCVPTVVSGTVVCQYSLYWDASTHGLSGQSVDGLTILPGAVLPTPAPICQNPVRIMPLGDSITKGYGSIQMNGYRRRLSISLQNQGYGISMVGSLSDGNEASPPVDFDPDHEGHGGWHAAGGSEGGLLPQVYDWLQANPADIVLLHIGTNDVTNYGDDADEVAQILDEIDRYNEDIIVILAQIINRMNYSGETSLYNQELKAMAQARIAEGDKLVLINMENALSYTFYDMNDDLHPNDVGYAKMAAVWESALIGILPKCP